METKKCPKCGAEIPVEMSFCLHCMERTDGVLEIRKKSVPNRKYIISVIIVFAIMTAVIILLVLLLTGKNGGESEESPASPKISEAVTENISEMTSDNETAVITSAEYVHTELQETTAVTKQTSKPSKSDNNISNSYDDNETANNSPEENEDREFSNEPQDTPSSQSPEHEDISSNEPPINDNSSSSKVNFEERFTERLNSWGASHVLTDTLSFSENGCTFTSNVGTDKVNCTVSANSDMTDFTLIIEPATEYTRYSTAVYIPDIVNEITYFVLDYRMSSNMRTDIGLMFENFESEVSFAENELSCNISTQAHNNGSYPITVSCTLD